MAWKEYLTYKQDIGSIDATISYYQERAERMREKLGKRFSLRTFDTYDATKDQEAYDKCFAYASGGYKDQRNGLLIVGSYGTGKTHLAAAIANKLIDDGVEVKFGTYQGLLEGVKNKFGERNNDALTELRTVELLIMDDIGKERVTEWTRSIMFDVVNARYEAMLPTVFTTNLNTQELEEYLGGAVYSRICETCVGVKTKSTDMRRKGLK